MREGSPAGDEGENLADDWLHCRSCHGAGQVLKHAVRSPIIERTIAPPLLRRK